MTAQMRIALARLLLSDAGQAATGRSSGGLLLLDEPTNHLDAAACKWLANFLRNSSGSVIIVSHDESLLEVRCCLGLLPGAAAAWGWFQARRSRPFTPQHSPAPRYP
jgi:ABC-type transport system involved in cytochrome bd biosynthesis fused ATPase/permease subunit